MHGLQSLKVIKSTSKNLSTNLSIHPCLSFYLSIYDQIRAPYHYSCSNHLHDSAAQHPCETKWNWFSLLLWSCHFSIVQVVCTDANVWVFWGEILYKWVLSLLQPTAVILIMPDPVRPSPSQAALLPKPLQDVISHGNFLPT